MKIHLFRLVAGSSLAAVGAVAAWLGYATVRSDIEAGVYRQKLSELAGEYESLREQYNEAVSRTAVTELVVGEDRSLKVRVRNAAGVLEEIDTPFDPSGEVYVDYALIDGRLLIRRVFDEHTPPSSATVIDPDLQYIDWSDPRATHGKAVYRSLTPGRWIVSITGTGSLGLTRLGDDEVAEIVHAPQVRDFETLEREVESDLDDVRFSEVVEQIVR